MRQSLRLPSKFEDHFFNSSLNYIILHKHFFHSLYSLFVSQSADLLYCRFLWIMGVCITLSFRVLRLRRVSKIKIASKILKRSLILFGLGLFTSNCKYKPNQNWLALFLLEIVFFLRQNIACVQLFISSAFLNLHESYRTFHSLDGNLEFYRIPGVLQRFGVCYLFVAMMQLLLSPTNNEERKV